MNARVISNADGEVYVKLDDAIGSILLLVVASGCKPNNNEVSLGSRSYNKIKRTSDIRWLDIRQKSDRIA